MTKDVNERFAALADHEDAPAVMRGWGWEGRITCSACPVQIHGHVDGSPFYFRARHSWQRFSVWTGGKFGRTSRSGFCDLLGLPPRAESFIREGGFGSPGDFDASWMKWSIAWRYVRAGIRAYRYEKLRKQGYQP